MGLCLEGLVKPSVVEKEAGMGLSLSGQAPKKSLRLYGSAPSPLRAHPEGLHSVIIPLIMNNER
jgi:hypothetical protein